MTSGICKLNTIMATEIFSRSDKRYPLNRNGVESLLKLA